VGEAAARLLETEGARVVAVADVGGGAQRVTGLDLRALARYAAEHGTVAGFPAGNPISNDELIGLDVDILVLAAIEGQVTAANAADVRARIVAEGANGPVTPDADPILRVNGVAVVPDILCNAGGVIVSYFEWAQNRAALAWTLREVNRRLRRQILEATASVWARAQDDGISYRLAAHAIAVERVVEALRLRGLYP
jgi:glutamate dehydrogenase (NAD(P)+)